MCLRSFTHRTDHILPHYLRCFIYWDQIRLDQYASDLSQYWNQIIPHHFRYLATLESDRLITMGSDHLTPIQLLQITRNRLFQISPDHSDNRNQIFSHHSRTFRSLQITSDHSMSFRSLESGHLTLLQFLQIIPHHNSDRRGYLEAQIHTCSCLQT